MKWLKNYQLFRESASIKPSKNIVSDMCISMILLNNEFLSNILDRGLSARYTENSQIFLTDLKNLLISKNRLNLGKYVDSKCIKDDEISKINGLFDDVKFNIEGDWNMLVSARNTARSIIDKLIPDEKLNSDSIVNIFWLGPNKDEDHDEDIVIELSSGKQYSFYLNKNISSSKTSSFSTFSDELIGENTEKLYSEEYLKKWNKLTQEWIRIVYDNSNKNIQLHIEKFIDPKRIDSIGYFEYYDIKHSDNKYKHLGEFIKEFDKNILKFSDLLNEIWKKRDNCFIDAQRVTRDWTETKIIIMNSKILENLITDSLKSKYPDDIIKMEDSDFKLANGDVKMKLIKTMVEKIGCLETPVYYVGSGGSSFNMIPSRQFFRQFYDDINVKFDYHVKFDVSEEEENNDFNIKLSMDIDDEPLIDMNILVKFSGGEMSGKLSAKYKFNISPNFNYLVSKKEIGDQDI